jgi:hypothetical protein
MYQPRMIDVDDKCGPVSGMNGKENGSDGRKCV